MKCLRCSAELPSQSQFCLRCGAPVQMPPSSFQPTGVIPPAGQPAFPSARSNNGPVIAIIAVLALLVVGLGAFLLAGVLAQKPDQADSNQLVQAPGQASGNGLVQAPAQAAPGPIVQAPGSAQPPPLVQDPTPTAPSTADIEDYLKFLKDIEARKIALINKQTADMMQMQAELLGKQAAAATDDQKSEQFLPDLRNQVAQIQKPWDDLAQAFNARKPPTSCQDVHDKYYDQLGKVEGLLVQIPTALSKAQSGDPSAALQALTPMQNGASNDADALARLADTALANVCDRYHLRKEFSIRLP